MYRCICKNTAKSACVIELILNLTLPLSLFWIMYVAKQHNILIKIWFRYLYFPIYFYLITENHFYD